MYKLIAHRGNNNHDYKENTMEALLNSLSMGYIFGVELDVRMTRDKKLVIIHDMTISKASDGYGFVKDMTLNDLLKFNFGNKKNKALITTLDSFLKHVKSDKIIMIEIKEESIIDYSIINVINKLLKKYKSLNLYVTSFNKKIIDEIKKINNNIKLGYNLLLNDKISNPDKIDFLCVNYLYINEINNNIETFIWTINSEKQFNKIKIYINNNVYIITDKAYLLKNM